ncbi:MAG: DUF4184 family protein [Pseudomonadota bacterium]|nr:DUF4184 family protein [Pseudomonadota bacterium]
MPFTISHVAAVVPFSRPLARWGVLSATVIGSMVPDFGFLMPWRPARIETHSAIGLFTFCLPVGLATFWVFQLLVKPAVTELLPDGAYSRWRAFAEPVDIGSIKQWALAACGVFAGAFTHLVWDAFTHEGARGIRMFPALDDPIVEIAGRHLVGTRLLQDVSSLVGFAIVLVVVAYGLRGKLPGEQVPARTLPAAERHAWTLAYVGTGLLLAASFLAMRRASLGASVAFVLGRYAIAALRGFTASLLMISLGVDLRLRVRR